jgi:1-acyl-sn-glycerol-3-phosphate acyltransferase
MLLEDGPLLIAANHPNSFLDAIILSSLFKKPIHSLARGDAFSGKFFTKILTSLNMLPVYRVSEGVENLEQNYTTFEACEQLFKESKIVLIFTEGLCKNEWHLRRFKKGTARLALTAWSDEIPLKILPLGFNYSSFRKFGKVVRLNFGDFIKRSDITSDLTSGKALIEINDLIRAQLEDLVYEIEPYDVERRKEIFKSDEPWYINATIFLPAVLGFILHAPFYYAVHFIIKDRSKDHYDSVMVGIFFLFYPFYILLLSLILFLITHNPASFLLFILMPITALCLLHVKKVIA